MILWNSEFLLVDLVLGCFTIFHLFLASTLLTVVDASFKKPLMVAHYAIVKRFSDIPYFVSFMTWSLSLMTLALAYQAGTTEDNNTAVTIRAIVSTPRTASPTG